MARDFQTYIKQQIADEVIYGCVIMAGDCRRTFVEEAYGVADVQTSRPMTTDAIFDLASLTKPVGVATSIVIAQDAQLLDLDRPFTDFLPQHRAHFATVPTVRQLGTHTSGVNYERPYDRFMALGGGELLVDAFYDLGSIAAPGTEFVYSCCNYLLLGLIVETVTGQPLEQFAEKQIFAPLQMTDTAWGMPRRDQLDRVVREHLVTTHGAVPEAQLSPELLALRRQDCLPSDETAQAALPHRVGNAGLFAPARDLARFCRMILNEASGILSAAARRELITPCTPPKLHRRSFGWDMAEVPGFSDKLIHHSGWSGQNIWIDLERGRFFIMLTNRNKDKYEECKSKRYETAKLMNEYF